MLFIAFTSIFSVCLGENAAKKKKRSCPFSSSKPRTKKKSKSEFDKKWAAKLAESDKGSFYRREKCEELDIQKSENAAVAESASRSKIQLEEPEEESQLSSSTPSADGMWKTISGRAIVSSKTLLQKRDESVSCQFCQGRVQVEENVATKHGLGSTWRIQCENESCPLHKTNSVFNSSEKSRAFERNRPQFLALSNRWWTFGGFAFVRVDFALVFGIFTDLANLSRNKHNIFLLLHEKRIVVCKLNDYYACTFTYLFKNFVFCPHAV